MDWHLRRKKGGIWRKRRLRNGFESKVKFSKLRGALFCKCYAKVYKHGKLERDAVPCIYLGKDPRSPGVLVRVIDGKRTTKAVRSAVLVKYDTVFPYANKTVPVPDPRKGLNYASDSEPEEDRTCVKDPEDSDPEDNGSGGDSGSDDGDLSDENSGSDSARGGKFARSIEST